MEKNTFTAGELAKMACVSLRTIRFYDVKGLLKPVGYTEGGYRLYDQHSFVRLQRILMLKYLGFSLQEIESLLSRDMDLDGQLLEQHKLLLQKKEELEKVISAIEIAQKSRGEEQWNALLHVSNLMSMQEKVKEQYESSKNLESRINIHSYSTSKENWFDWVYDRMGIKGDWKIFELGCGTGILWDYNIHKLPGKLDITLSDNSEGMLEQTRKNLAKHKAFLQERNIHITYKLCDGNALSIEKNTYDLVVANHMLYHITNLDGCLNNISKALKKGGRLCCSTIGNEHMKELHDLVESFDTGIKIEMPFTDITKSFRLENGESKLKPYFSKIRRDIQDNDLIVDDVEVIYNYVYSYPGNALYVLDKYGDRFRKQIQDRIDKEGAFYIHKSTGMFVCER